MGSLIELNDTLRISKEQGFPKDLVYEKHLDKPFKAEDFLGMVFDFKEKQNIRLYQQPPVRTFLVEDIDGKWLHWGLCQILEIKHDYVNKVTSGKYKIVDIYTPEVMEKAFNIIFKDGVGPDYFAK